jgi:hypothetical protein
MAKDSFTLDHNVSWKYVLMVALRARNALTIPRTLYSLTLMSQLGNLADYTLHMRLLISISPSR